MLQTDFSGIPTVFLPIPPASNTVSSPCTFGTIKHRPCQLVVFSMAVLVLLVVVPSSIALLRHRFAIIHTSSTEESTQSESDDPIASESEPLYIPGSFSFASSPSSAASVAFLYNCERYHESVQFVLRWHLEDIFASPTSNPAASFVISFAAQAVSLLGVVVVRVPDSLNMTVFVRGLTASLFRPSLHSYPLNAHRASLRWP